MKQIYAFLAVITLFVLINVSFSSSYSVKPLAAVQVDPSEDSVLDVSVVLGSDSLNMLLVQAIWDKDKAQLQNVLKQGVDVNWVNEVDGYAPIHWAVERGFSDILQILISNGANVNAMTIGAIGKDRSALHIAAEAGNPTIVKALIESGADVNSTTDYKETPLHGVRLFVKNVEVIQLLIEAGADINASTVFGSTPLHSASMLGAGRCCFFVDRKGSICGYGKQTRSNASSSRRTAWAC